MSPASPLICQTFLPPPDRLPALHGCGNVPYDHEKCNSARGLTQPSCLESYSCRSGWPALSGSFPPQQRLASPGMDDRTTEAALSLTKFGVGQPVRRSEDPKLVRGEGRYTDDINRPGQAYAVMVRSSDRAWRHPRHRHRRRQGDAGRARGLYRGRSDRLRRAQMQPAAQEPRRLADPLYAAAGARRRQGALSSAIRSPA